MLCGGVDAAGDASALGDEVERQHPRRHRALEDSEALISSVFEEIQDTPHRKASGINRSNVVEGLCLEKLDVLPTALAEVPVARASRAARCLSNVGPFPAPEAAARS